MTNVELDIATSFLIRWWNETPHPIIMAKIREINSRRDSELLASWIISAEASINSLDKSG